MAPFHNRDRFITLATEQIWSKKGLQNKDSPRRASIIFVPLLPKLSLNDVFGRVCSVREAQPPLIRWSCFQRAKFKPPRWSYFGHVSKVFIFLLSQRFSWTKKKKKKTWTSRRQKYIRAAALLTASQRSAGTTLLTWKVCNATCCTWHISRVVPSKEQHHREHSRWMWAAAQRLPQFESHYLGASLSCGGRAQGCLGLLYNMLLSGIFPCLWQHTRHASITMALMCSSTAFQVKGPPVQWDILTLGHTYTIVTDLHQHSPQLSQAFSEGSIMKTGQLLRNMTPNLLI